MLFSGVLNETVAEKVHDRLLVDPTGLSLRETVGAMNFYHRFPVLFADPHTKGDLEVNHAVKSLLERNVLRFLEEVKAGSVEMTFGDLEDVVQCFSFAVSCHGCVEGSREETWVRTLLAAVADSDEDKGVSRFCVMCCCGQ